jgi:hypothetical protein
MFDEQCIVVYGLSSQHHTDAVINPARSSGSNKTEQTHTVQLGWPVFECSVRTCRPQAAFGSGRLERSFGAVRSWG